MSKNLDYTFLNVPLPGDIARRKLGHKLAFFSAQRKNLPDTLFAPCIGVQNRHTAFQSSAENLYII